METPPQRMSMDAPRTGEAITGDALTSLSVLSSAHEIVRANPDRPTGPSEAVSETGTVSFKGRSHPVAADEAARLLTWLDDQEAGPGWPSPAERRAAACLRRVAGCVRACVGGGACVRAAHGWAPRARRARWVGIKTVWAL